MIKIGAISNMAIHSRRRLNKKPHQGYDKPWRKIK